VPALRDQRWWLTFTPTVYAVVALMALPLSVQSDTWYTLVSGRFIAEHGIPQMNNLTVIGAGHPWRDQQWLAQVMLYQLERHLGFLPMLLISNLVLWSTVPLLVWAAYRRGLSPGHCALIALASLPSLYAYSVVRAQIFSLPCFVAELWLLSTIEDHPRRAIWLAPLLLFWGNTHGAVMLGCLAVVVWVAVKLMKTGWENRYRSSKAIVQAVPWRWLGLLPVLIFAVITPYGLSIIDYYRNIETNTAFSRVITEWRPLNAAFFYSWPILAMIALAAGVIGARWRRIDPFLLLLTGALAIIAIHTVRFGIFFVLAGCWMIVDAWRPHSTTLASAPTSPARAPRWLVGLISLLFIISIGEVVHYSTQSAPAFARSLVYQPARMLPTIDRLEHQRQQRVFADDQLSDYLLWKRPQLAGSVAFDARLELLSSQQLLQLANTLNAADGWQRQLGEYDIAIVTKSVHPQLARALATSADWQIVYQNPDLIIVSRIG
jgi:hypothetical protein